MARPVKEEDKQKAYLIGTDGITVAAVHYFEDEDKWCYEDCDMNDGGWCDINVTHVIDPEDLLKLIGI